MGMRNIEFEAGIALSVAVAAEDEMDDKRESRKVAEIVFSAAFKV